MAFKISTLAAGLLAVAKGSWALDLDVYSQDSLKDVSRSIAADIMSLYANHTIPGLFDTNTYFWDAGLAWDTLIYYYAQVGDNQYVDVIRQALEWQESSTLNFMPTNQTKNLANDDQATWALAAMTAAEQGFPKPDGNATWVQLAQNVFDSQVARWDDQTCGGGLRWQIFSFNSGYNYKNSFSNGDFFLLASRLARFTGNNTYYDWAEKTYEWSKQVGLISSKGQVFDGTQATNNCSQINRIQWTATAGAYINGMAYLSNSSFADASRKNGAVADLSTLVGSALSTFVDDNQVIYEVACETAGTCPPDGWAFRSLLVRGLATLQYFGGGLDANTTSTITKVLQRSAEGAAGACSGGSNSTACGGTWTTAEYDDNTGLESDTSALNIMLANIRVLDIANQNTTSPAAESPSGSGSGSGTTNNNASGTTSAGSPAASTGAASTLVGSMGMLAALAAAVVSFA